VSQLPSPVRELVTSVSGGAPNTPVTSPKPAPAPVVKPNNAAAPRPVAAPRTRVAAPPALRGSTFATGRSTSGLPRLGAGTAVPQLADLFAVPDVATPVEIAPQAAAPAGHPAVPAGLPALAVLVAVVTLGGAATAHLTALRTRRSSASA
jgi:hypothetical protein